jgi:hypothetical protein
MEQRYDVLDKVKSYRGGMSPSPCRDRSRISSLRLPAF